MDAFVIPYFFRFIPYFLRVTTIVRILRWFYYPDAE